MKVNLIANFQANTGLMQDALLLRGILSVQFGEDVKIFKVPHMLPECGEADVNFFLEVINPSLFPYARKNIWLPNPEWTYKTWIPYISMVDEVWVKTHEAETIFKQYTDKVYFTGWTSMDKAYLAERDKKNYHKAIVPVGKNIYRHPKPIFQAYLKLKHDYPEEYKEAPELYIVHSPDHIGITVPEEIAPKVHLISKVLSDTEYNDLLKECGLCICMSLSEGFGHAVNEAMSAGCNLILSPISPFKDNLYRSLDVYVEALEIAEQPDCLGKLVDVNTDSLEKKLREYIAKPFKAKKELSKYTRGIYEGNHSQWIERMKDQLVASMPAINETSYSLRDTFPKEDELPDVSVLCITKDRRAFMPLLKYCYMIQSYPEDKMEIVIVDDGDDPIEDTLFGVPNVKYVRCDPGMTISQKRNLGVENAMYDIIAVMDDDDVYPNNSILQRVAMLMKEPKKQCGFCTTIPCYDIAKYSSFMNVPPITLKMSERVSEATLIFTKAFWEENKFDDMVHIGEGNAFVHGREHMCREISPQEVIVSLVHPKNTSSRKLPNIPESNGCHWGFNENLYALVSQIGQDLITHTE